MKLKSFTKLAMVSAVALSVAYAGGAYAANEIGTPQTVNISGTVTNDIGMAITDADLGTFTAVKDTVDVAVATVDPDGTVHDDTGAGFGSLQPAEIVFDPTDQPAPAIVDLSGGYGNYAVLMGYTNVQPLINGANTIHISHLTYDLDTPGVWEWGGTPGGPATMTPGTGVLTAGARTVHVGYSLATDTATAGSYPNGVYAGSFQIVMTY
jgi:hypothetical protein